MPDVDVTTWLLQEKVRLINHDTGWTSIGEIAREDNTMRLAVVCPSGGFGICEYSRTGTYDEDGLPIFSTGPDVA